MSPLTLFIPLYFIGLMIKGKSKKAGAIYDLLWSLGILVWAAGVYEDGDSIALFGTIELPPVVFILILVGVMISEVVTLVQAFREKPAPIEEAASAEQAAIEQREAARIDAPCALYIVHMRGIIGTAAKVQLTLNGHSIGELANSAYLLARTEVRENRLVATGAGFPHGAEIEFQAQSGGEVRVNLELRSGKGIQMSLADAVGYRVPRHGKKRVRPVKKGYILWSITNFWAYLLGIVPLIMTLKAAKTPFDDVAAQKLRSAKKWNLWMTGILLGAMVIAFLSRFALR